ncbi:60S ribosomal protein L21-1 [Planoprotostelium fungivorum]|uniref:60S ribosomal protein L21-1 n=1 Tax=Planoprotostelium fungivorum TaxID=1890364 RepID=A0A2P6NIB1_9EUKA|nr:60S ribosomal protein L21-1 [Planoprotostelium fungivorum]
MPHSFGYKARTRSKFARPFRQHGPTHLSTYLTTYKLGDYVDVKANGSIQKGMPHKFYHGRTGRVWNVTRRAIGVEVNKQVRNRIIAKRISVRVEHVRPSRCRVDFLARLNRSAEERKAAKASGQHKRLPEQPKTAHFVKNSGVEHIHVLRYEELI